MLYVAHAVEVAIDVDVAILRHDGGHWLGASDLDARGLLDGALAVADIASYAAVMQRHQVGWLARHGAYHGPHGAGVAQRLAILIDNGKITVGEQAIDILHPCIYAERLILVGHLVKLNGQTGEHPCMVFLIEAGYAETTL